MTEARFIYSRHATLDMAERMLEEMYATGDVTEGERPKIEKRRRSRTGEFYYVITLPA